MSSSQIVIVTLALSAVMIPGWAVYSALRCTAGWRSWILYRINRMYAVLLFGWRSNKDCPFPKDDAAIIVANHTSPVDPILIWNAHNKNWPRHEQRIPGFLMAQEFYSSGGVIGWICRTMESIPVNREGRDMAAVRAGLKRLADRKWLGLFPEGGINRAPEKGLGEANTGVAYLALKSGAPIYPVFIHNAPRAKGMVGCFFKAARARVTYGEPILLPDQFEGKLTSEKLEVATAVVMEKLEELGRDRWFEVK